MPFLHKHTSFLPFFLESQMKMDDDENDDDI